MTLDEEIELSIANNGAELCMEIGLLRVKVTNKLRSIYAELMETDEEYQVAFSDQFMAAKTSPKFAEMKYNEIKSILDSGERALKSKENPLLSIKIKMAKLNEEIRHWNEQLENLKQAGYANKTLLEWRRFLSGTDK